MKKNNASYTGLFAVFVALLVLIAIQTSFSIIRLKSLKGETNPVSVDFNFRNFRNNTFQTQVEAYLRENLGFREFLIPVYNQYIWDFYKKTENQGVFFGKENWLFFYEHLLDQYESLTYKYTNSGEEMSAIFEREAKATYYLQEILKEYGITLFVGIAPSKNELYPEYLPENTQFNRSGGVWSYLYYTKEFNRLGVNYIDFNAIFKSLKGKVDYPLFYKSSSHYSMIAAAYEADTLIRFMEEKSGLNLLNIKTGESYADHPQHIDKDIEELLNLIRPLEKTKYVYVKTEAIPDKTAVKARWLTVGDSFYWNLTAAMPLEEIFNDTPFWYYNKEVYYDSLHHDVAETDMLEELLKSDFIMLYWCPINLYCLDHGFVTNALVSLCYEDKEKDDIKDALIRKIKNDTKWYDSVVTQAKEKNISIEEALDENADYTLKENPQEYFPKVFGDSIPSYRNSRIKVLLEQKKQ